MSALVSNFPGAHLVPHIAPQEDGSQHGPRRPHFSQRYQRLSSFAFCFALPTPPPQRVCGRGRQSFSSNRDNFSLSRNSKWGRRGRNQFQRCVYGRQEWAGWEE
jgi:hypothetical protein